MIRVNSHLNFDGQCEKAFRFYEKCLGGKIMFMMTWGESPMSKEVSPDWAKKVIHLSFTVGSQNLSGADAPPGHYEKPQGFSVALDVTEVVEADSIFKALSENGSVQMPIQETFWAKRFGMVIDQFGIPWMINCGKGMEK